MAARMLISPAPQRCREPEWTSPEKKPPSTQRRLGEFGVVCQRPASSVKDSPASSVKSLPASSVQESEKRNYGVRGMCGTFAGKRPPKSEDRLKQFLQGRDEHKQRLQQTPKGRKRQATDAQQHYREFVKAMLPYEIEGNGKGRLTRVAAKWKNQQTMPEKLAQGNKSVF